jgi:Phosphotransferase enzyme family
MSTPDIPAGSGSAITEALRNRLLRRADWRFLLANSKIRKSVCYHHGRLAKAVALISDDTVDPHTNPIGECDLAVAVNPTRLILRSAFSALQPGGCCYAEWYTPSIAGHQHVQRLIKSVGFESISCYWAWPWPSVWPARFWVPLETHGSFQHFIASRPQPRHALRRLGSPILRFAWRLSMRIGLAVPICAVARKTDRMDVPAGQSGSRPQTQVEPWFFPMLRERWSEWGLGGKPERLSWLLLTGGPRAISKIVGLVFAEPDSRPRIAAKMPRVAESLETLRKEADILCSLHQLRPEGFSGIPQVLFWQQDNDQVVLGETALAGTPLLYLLRRHNYRHLALKGTYWLSEMAGPLKARTAWWHRLVEPVFEDFSTSFGEIVDQRMLDETRSTLGGLGSLPLVCEQRDFSPWNVLLSPENELVVLDWESAELNGLPGLDLWYFLTHLAIFLEDAIPAGRVRTAYRKLLDASTFTGSIAAECVAYYVQKLRISSEDFSRLRMLVWLVHSRSEYMHFTADRGGPPPAEKLRRSVFFQLWEEEVRAHRRERR